MERSDVNRTETFNKARRKRRSKAGPLEWKQRKKEKEQ